MTAKMLTISVEKYNELLNDNMRQSERIAELESVLQPFSDKAFEVRAGVSAMPMPDIHGVLVPYRELRIARETLGDDW
jgi:hypothetical protein